TRSLRDWSSDVCSSDLICSRFALITNLPLRFPVVKQNEKRKGRFVMRAKRLLIGGLCAAGLTVMASSVYAAGQYGPGVTDTEIKIGRGSCRERGENWVL